MRSIRKSRMVAVGAMAAAFAVAAGGTASADTLTGWVSPAGSYSGYSYLATSTIINAPRVTAESKVYTVNGASAPAAYMGVRARLFKSGALCEVVDYKYNSTPTASLTIGTPGPGCGAGSYNSHGFVSTYDAVNGYKSYVTFPSNPLDYFPPAARGVASDTPETDLPGGVNEEGQSFGSGADAQDDAQLPDLVLSIGDDGGVGYVKSSDLATAPLSPEQVTSLPVVPDGAQQVYDSPERTVPLYAEDGITTVGQFTIS